MAKTNLIDDSLEWIKCVENECIQECVWLFCPTEDDTPTVVLDLVGKVQLLDTGVLWIEGDTATVKQCEYRDFAIAREDYLDQRLPRLGDMIAFELGDRVCVAEVRGRVEGQKLAHWTWIDNRRCQMRVRTIICGEYTRDEWDEFLADNV